MNSAGAQVVWGMFPSFKCQESRENTSKVKLTTNRLNNFQIVMDDSIDLTVIGSTRSNRFTFKNVPAGHHHFVVSTNRKGFYTEPFNHSFSIQTEGNGDTYLVKLPKRKLRTAVKVVGGVYARTLTDLKHLPQTRPQNPLRRQRHLPNSRKNCGLALNL